jgi:hypothetical protein
MSTVARAGQRFRHFPGFTPDRSGARMPEPLGNFKNLKLPTNPGRMTSASD